MVEIKFKDNVLHLGTVPFDQFSKGSLFSPLGITEFILGRYTLSERSNIKMGIVRDYAVQIGLMEENDDFIIIPKKEGYQIITSNPLITPSDAELKKIKIIPYSQFPPIAFQLEKFLMLITNSSDAGREACDCLEERVNFREINGIYALRDSPRIRQLSKYHPINAVEIAYSSEHKVILEN